MDHNLSSEPLQYGRLLKTANMDIVLDLVTRQGLNVGCLYDDDQTLDGSPTD